LFPTFAGARLLGLRLLGARWAVALRLLGGKLALPFVLVLLGGRPALPFVLVLLGGRLALPFVLALLGGRCVPALLLDGRRLSSRLLAAWLTLPFLPLADLSAPPLAWREAARASAVAFRFVVGRARFAELWLLGARSVAPFAARRLEGR
jgi:hypothetical protein